MHPPTLEHFVSGQDDTSVAYLYDTNGTASTQQLRWDRLWGEGKWILLWTDKENAMRLIKQTAVAQIN